jgi:hypothetical protein
MQVSVDLLVREGLRGYKLLVVFLETVFKASAGLSRCADFCGRLRP